MTKKHLFLLFASVMCIALLSMPRAFAETRSETTSVTVEGTASVGNANYAEARNRAISSALGNAIARAVERAIPLHVRITQSSDIDDILSASSRHYISEYRILDETFDGAFYGITLSATVWTGRILNDLEGIRSEAREPDTARAGTGTSETAVFILSIGGIESYAQYTSLKTFLMRKMPLVKTVREHAVQYGMVEFQIHAEGGATAFADSLSSAELPGTTIVIKKQTDSRIDVDIRQ